MKMNDEIYDVLSKFQRWLPLVGTLYLGLTKVWGLPYGNEINQTVILLATFLAGTLEVSTYYYNKQKGGDQ